MEADRKTQTVITDPKFVILNVYFCPPTTVKKVRQYWARCFVPGGNSTSLADDEEFQKEMIGENNSNSKNIHSNRLEMFLL